jgi:hypothetical protein
MKRERKYDEQRKEIRFGSRFPVILWCEFHENNNIILQQHWPQGLQIGLKSR